jgi:hypothetical protein
MRFRLPPFYRKCAFGVMALLLWAAVPTHVIAQEQAAEKTLRIGSHVLLDAPWEKHTSNENRQIVAALKARTDLGEIETLPTDRLYQLYQTGDLDCILTGGWPHDDPQLSSQRALIFEVRLYRLPTMKLSIRDEILVGRMKQFPPPALPLDDTLVDWLPLQNLKQGFDLLRAGRIDALLADPSHVHNSPDGPQSGIVPADLPPVKRFAVPLICHDTPDNRAFITSLDQTALTQ